MDTEQDAKKEAAIATTEAGKLSEQVYAIKIRKDQDVTEATEKLVEIKRIHKNIDTRRKTITSPLRKAIKDIDELFKEPLAQLKDSEALIKEAIIKYHEAVERRAAKRADKIESQADAGEIGIADTMGKISNIKQAESHVRTENGSANIRTITRIRITDPSKVPTKYFLRPRVIEALRIEVEDDVRRLGGEVPTGAEKYEEKNLAVRGA